VLVGLCVIPFGVGLLSKCDYSDYAGSQQRDLRRNFWIGGNWNSCLTIRLNVVKNKLWELFAKNAFWREEL
jgi:hypothetical protein